MVLTENALKTYLEQRHIHITEQKKSEILEYLGRSRENRKFGQSKIFTSILERWLGNCYFSSHFCPTFCPHPQTEERLEYLMLKVLSANRNRINIQKENAVLNAKG